MNSGKAGLKAVMAVSRAIIPRVKRSASGFINGVPVSAYRRLVVLAVVPGGRIGLIGKVATTLLALVEYGSAGFTVNDVEDDLFRLSSYIHTLRHDYGLAIETAHEDHEGGWHARYRLVSRVSIIGWAR